MPVYHYRGFDNTGRVVRGSLAADNELGLEDKLRIAGLWLVDAETDPDSAADKRRADRPKWLQWFTKTSRRDLIEFCTLMSFLTKVGISLVQALQIAAQDCDDRRFREVLHGLQRHLQGGLHFYEALEKYPEVFAPNFTYMVRAGEMSGNLPNTLEEIRRYLTWLDQVIADVRQATIYPAIVFSVVSMFVLFLFSFVVPRFALLLEATKVPLPLVTQAVLWVSTFAKATWWLWLIGTVVAVIGTQIGRRKSKAFALRYDSYKLRLPIFGPLNLMLAMARFTQNLAILYRSGIPIIQAFRLCEGLVGNAVVEKAVAESADRLRAGDTISEAVRRQPVFPAILVRMIVTGESSGTLDSSLQSVADYYNEIVPRKIKKLFSTLEPLMTLFLVFLVGTVALAIYLPILSLMSAIQNR